MEGRSKLKIVNYNVLCIVSFVCHQVFLFNIPPFVPLVISNDIRSHAFIILVIFVMVTWLAGLVAEVWHAASTVHAQVCIKV